MNWKNIGFDALRKAISALNKLPQVKVLNNKINIQTNADLASHDALIASLHTNRVQGEVFSEEAEKVIKINGGDPNTLIVLDPLDNTHLYLRGEKAFCSVAMMVIRNHQPIYSFVGDIVSGDIYHCDEKKSYKNNKLLSIPTKVPGRKIILGWAPYQLRLERLYQCLGPLTSRDYYLYNFGGQLQAVKIASGSYDAYVEVRAETINEFCAALIVERAGGYVTTIQGKPVSYHPHQKQTLLISRTKKIHQQLLQQFVGKDYED